ncbi:MAG: pyrimidine 5'-nucleotidase [Caulobacteraceae bacterium]
MNQDPPGAVPSAAQGADLRRIDTWIFDLDNTLYPMGTEVQAQMDARITGYVVRETGLPPEEALALQKKYLHEHGATLAGMMAHHGVDPYGFLEEVHDVSLDSVSPDAALHTALERLPGRRLVFTNASSGHAERVLARLGYAGLFEHVFHLEAADLTPKPQAAAYDALIRLHGVTPKSAVFFEDTETNLAPAARLGMATVLVGPHATASTADFVDHRTNDLTAFLQAAQVREP